MGALIVAAVIGLLTLSNYVAGVILVLSYKKNPEAATFFTIQHGWAEAETPKEKKKVKASAFVALFLCLGAPGFLLQMMFRDTKLNLHGNARFASRKDLQSEGMLKESSTGILLGKHGNSYLRLPGYEFVLLAAPTRSGKGVGFCVPNMLAFPDSAVVLDIKGENYNLTSKFRQQHLGNEVYYFNPFSETTHRWNPLSYVSEDPNFRSNDLMALAQIIYPPNEKDPFWPDSARNLFIGLCLLVLETPSLPKTMGEVLRQGSGKGQEITDYLRHIITVREATATPLSSDCVDALNRFLNNPDTTLKNIVSSFTAPLTVFGVAVVDKATSADDFDLRDVRKRKMTIYLHIPAKEVVQAGFILNLFFSQLINENVKQLPEENPELKHQCFMMMDEFTAMGKVSILAKGVGYIAGYNMRLGIIIQDRSQLESVYGREDAHNIISNMGVMIVFTPSQVKEAEEYSKLIGNQTLKVTSKQRSSGGGAGKSSSSESESLQARAVMLPQELLSMDRKQELIVRPGIPVIHADKIRYFDDEFFKKRFNSVPMHTVHINGEPRVVPVPLPLPRTNWRIFRQAQARSNYYLQDDFSDLSPAVMSLDEESILDLINRDAAEMSSPELDALCVALVRQKVDDYEKRFFDVYDTVE